MGIHINPSRKQYERAVNSEVFVDKTEMIQYLNTVIDTNQQYVCVSRPRRFGKTMAADMISAYYSREADSHSLFSSLQISSCPPITISHKTICWDTYLGKYDVLRIEITDYMSETVPFSESLSLMQKRLSAELHGVYPNVQLLDPADLMQTMSDIYAVTNIPFVIIIDEWDAPFREQSSDKDSQKIYLEFLRRWLKNKEYVALAYMTGILPIKKYGKHSALNMFREFSMIQPMQLAPYMGFTAEEVERECLKRNLKFSSFKQWYDGYRLSNKVSSDILSPDAVIDESVYREYEIYSPYSVVNAIITKQFDNYWNQTETYTALQKYIEWNFQGLKEDVALLMNNGRISIDITGYQNDMTTFHTKDDILTMLVHLGYLAYDRDTSEVFIPNLEVKQVFSSSTKSETWATTFQALRDSQRLLEATWNCDEKTVAELLEAAHDNAENRTYNSEAALSYAIQLAYFSALNYYTVIPEFDSGKGYADIVYLPKVPDHPALLIELKYDQSAETAINQIHRQNYPDRLVHYKGNLILVAISYSKDNDNNSPSFKHHSCVIEKA